MELGADGKAVKFYDVAPFDLHLTPESVAAAAATVTAAKEGWGTG
jgi:hypothetical protein